jgi:hypothetical protein
MSALGRAALFPVLIASVAASPQTRREDEPLCNEKSVILDGVGGYCGCEAINNAEEVLEDAMPGYDGLLPPSDDRG